MDERTLFYNRVADIENGINQFKVEIAAYESAQIAKRMETDRLRQINKALKERERIARENYLKQLRAKGGIN